MSRIVKYLLWLIGAFVALFALAAIALSLFFDPNDFRDEISNKVRDETGRELTIEGDISLDVFPWLAVEVGKSSLGNAPAFGSEPMASFDRASFSVRLLPAILRQEVIVGAADIEGLQLNLRINQRGDSNWSDLIEEQSTDSSADADSGGDIDINSVDITNASVLYTDDEAGEVIALDAINLRIGRLRSDGTAVPVDAAMNFDMQTAGLSGSIEVETMLSFNTESGLLTLGDLAADGSVEGLASIPTTLRIQTDRIEVATESSQVTMQPVVLEIVDVKINADVQPFTYDDQIMPKATIAIDAFSPRSIMQSFDIEPPVTADPVALTRVIVAAEAQLTTSAIELTDVVIKLDDTSVKGTLSVPLVETGFFKFDLTGDTIELARYMEPASESDASSGEDAVSVEIPTDIIRPLNARGKIKLQTASLGDIVFESIEMGLNASQGKMRIFPITSKLFGGSYNGDVRIDVSGSVPALSVDEKIDGVDLGKLSMAMFQQEKVTGTIEGAFTLAGRGATLADIQRDLSGNMSMRLADGTYEGRDVWYELRRARALLKGEEAPEPVRPARTEFSSVRVSGAVAKGIMRSDDLLAELPFMQLTGAGQVDIAAATINYSLSARILENPELKAAATPEELAAFTKAVIPLKITGPLASPSIKPDVEKLLRQRVEDEVKDKLKDTLKGLFD